MPSLWELLCVSRQKYSTHRVGSVQPQSAGVAERPDLEHDRSGHRRPIWSESAYGTDPASGKPDNQQQPRPTHSLVDRKGISDYTQDSPSMPGRDITKNNFIDCSGQSVTGFSSPTSAPREHAKRNYDDDDDARNKKDGRRRHVQDIFNEGGFARRSKPKAAAGKAGASSEAGGSRGDDSADDPAAARARQSVAPERDSSSHQSTSKTALVVSKPCRGPANSRPYNDDNNNIESKARNKKGIRTDNMAHYAPRIVSGLSFSEKKARATKVDTSKYPQAAGHFPGSRLSRKITTLSVGRRQGSMINVSPSYTSAGDALQKVWREGPSGWSILTGLILDKGWKDNISVRLTKRKIILRRKTHLTDAMCILALFGLVCNIIQTELKLADGGPYTATRQIVMILLTFSTFGLLGSLLSYHISEIQLQTVDCSVDDWRLLTSRHFYFITALELLSAAIQPLPNFGNIEDLWPYSEIVNSLSVLMFARLYLITRFLLVHSHLVTDVATQSLGAINKVKIDCAFVIKAMMTENPGMILTTTMAAIILVGAWSLRVCESDINWRTENNTEHSTAFQAFKGFSKKRGIEVETGLMSYTDATWLAAITFFTIGYGDVTPVTRCGRVTCVAIGLLGVGLTALLVAVLGQKMEQSRAEKYLHCFVSRIKIDRKIKKTATQIIRCVVKFWKLNRLKGANEKTKRHMGLHIYGELMQAARKMRELKSHKATISEYVVGMIEINTQLSAMVEVNEMIKERQDLIYTQYELLETRFNRMEQCLKHIAMKVAPESYPESFEVHDSSPTDP